MQSSVEQLEGLAHKLTVEVPAERVDEAVKQRLKEIRPRIRLDGFRPGKVPPHIVQQKYSASVRQEILSDLIESSYREALLETDYEPVAPPKIEILSGFAANEPLQYSAVFEIMPEVKEVKGIGEFNITLPESELTDKDVDEMVETLRRQQANFIKKEGSAEESDRVTVDFEGKINGKPFEHNQGENIKFVIGSGYMLPDFEQGIKGGRLDEERHFDVTFPEDYTDESISGKTAQFTATIKNIESMQLPEVNEAFIKNFGIESGDEQAFKSAIRENMTRELNNAQRRIKRERMLEAILEKNSDQIIAESHVEQEIAKMANEMKLEQQFPDKQQYQTIAKSIFDKPARRRVRLGVLVGKLFEDNDLTLDNERVEERLEAIASTYEDPEEIRTFYKQNKQAKLNLESAILEEQLIDKLYEQTNISYEKKTFQELMAINAELQN